MLGDDFVGAEVADGQRFSYDGYSKSVRGRGHAWATCSTNYITLHDLLTEIAPSFLSMVLLDVGFGANECLALM